RIGKAFLHDTVKAGDLGVCQPVGELVDGSVDIGSRQILVLVDSQHDCGLGIAPFEFGQDEALRDIAKFEQDLIYKGDLLRIRFALFTATSHAAGQLHDEQGEYLNRAIVNI